jgi:hypothetical protein
MYHYLSTPLPFISRFKGVALAAVVALSATSLFAEDPQLTADFDVPYRSSVTFQNTTLNEEGTEPLGGGANGRLEYMMERHGGKLTPESMEAISAAINTANLTASGAAWLNIGPTNANRFQNGINVPAVDSGRARKILVDPSNSSRVFLLTSGGGLWMTNDIKANKPVWTALSDTVGVAGGGVAFGQTANTIYLGTGDPFDFGAGGFMAKSTNGGQTWGANITLPGATRITDVKVDTSNPLVDVVMVSSDFGLFRSTNSGASFTKVVSANLSNAVWNLQKTTAGWLATGKTGSLTDSSSGYVSLSTDQGATWNPVTMGPAYVGAGRTTLASTGDNVVYAIAANLPGSAQKDMYKSVDGGISWISLGVNSSKVPVNPNPYSPNMNILSGQAWYNQSIAVDPTDASRNTVYIAGVYSSAKTTTGGTSWALLSSWIGYYHLPYVHADHHTSTVAGDGTVYLGHDGGMSVSFDAGKSFQNNVNEGLVTHLIYAMANGTKDTDNILIGLQDNGTRYRRSNSTVYNGSIGGDGFGVTWSQANNGISMGSYVFCDIRRFTQNPPNQQTKYESAITGIDRNFAYFVTPLANPTAAADPTGLVFFTNTQNNIYRTSNGGLNWVAIGRGEPGGNLPFAVNVRAVSHGVGFSPNDLNYVGVAAPGGRVWLTTNGGTTWTARQVNLLVPGWLGFNSNVAYASNNSTIYVASDGQPSNGPFGRVAKSTDGGVSWTSSATGLPAGMPVNKLLVDPSSPTGQIVYAATWVGVYKTTDGGANWSQYGSGFPRAEVSDLYLNPDGKFLRVSTYGRGVWQIQP